jgi:alanyl-tRNA synthetase
MVVKVYSVGDYSKEVCGGPHVTSTGELGGFKVLKEEAVGQGVRRIRAVVDG